MKSFQLKLILILLFLSVNIFFVFKLWELYNSKNVFTKDEISQAVSVLCEKGVNISVDKVITKKNVPDVIKLNFNSSSSEGIAKRVMREKYSTFTVPDGFSYTGSSESLSFKQDYSITYTYTPSNITKEDVLKKLNTSTAVEKSGKKETERLTKTLFSDINSEPYKVSLIPLRSTVVDGITYIEAIEAVDLYKIEKAKIIAAVKDGKLLYLSGTLFFAEGYEDYSSNAFDSINILFEIDEKESEITSMEIIYSFVFDEKDSVYLAPSYAFTYSDNTREIYDATSALKRSS